MGERYINSTKSAETSPGGCCGLHQYQDVRPLLQFIIIQVRNSRYNNTTGSPSSDFEPIIVKNKILLKKMVYFYFIQCHNAL